MSPDEVFACFYFFLSKGHGELFANYDFKGSLCIQFENNQLKMRSQKQKDMLGYYKETWARNNGVGRWQFSGSHGQWKVYAYLERTNKLSDNLNAFGEKKS